MQLTITEKFDALPSWIKWLVGSLFIGSTVFGFIYILAGVLRFVGVDFDWVFYPVARDVLFNGMSPYVNYHYVYVPWGIIPFLPFAIFPKEIAAALYLLLGLCIYILVARKLGANLFGVLLFIFAPPVWLDLSWGNLNSITLLGVILPPWLGLFFLAIKPQVGIGYAIYIFFESLREGGVLKVVKVFAPVSVALLLSIAIFGFWPSTQYHPVGANPNISFWPWLVPFGLWLLVRGIRNRNAKMSTASSPFLAPYTSYSGYVVTLLPFLNNNFDLLIIVGGMYLTSIIRMVIGY